MQKIRAMLLRCGDALVDFLPVKSVDGRDAAVPVAGGSCLNISVGIARLGAPAGFVGGISTDLFGRIVADHAFASHVQLRDAKRSDHAEKAKSLIKARAGLVVITRGIKGAQAWHGEVGTVEVQAPTVDVVDTIGAGDSFQAGLLFALRAIGRIEAEALAQIKSDELARALSF